jgi:hypothetical protein
MSSPNVAASTVFLTGIPDALTSFRQCLAPVYAIFNMLDRESTGSEDVNIQLVRAILEHNKVLTDHTRPRISTAIAKIQVRLMRSADAGMNLAIMNADRISAQSVEFTVLTVLKATYEIEGIKQWTTEYD